MPRARLRTKVIDSPRPARAVLASAANLTSGRPPLPTTGTTNTSKAVIGGDTSWHADCWTYFDSIPEYHYAVTWVGNLLSRAVLYVVKNGEKVVDEKITELLSSLFDGPEGQSDMLRQLGVHYTVAGDCFLIGINAGDTEKDDWLIAAANQTSRSDEGVWKVANETFEGVGKPLAIRLWQPHPQNRLNSDSPSHAALTVLQELDGLTRKNAADIDSRLSGAGILLVPNEISFGKPATLALDAENEEDTDPAPELTKPEELVEILIEVGSIALADQSSPAAKVPVILQGPGDHLAQIKHLTFSTPLDERAEAMRTEAIRRLALGMDMPPEILTGTSDMNHWSSWQLEEAAIKAHTEPLLAAICSALTEGYLRPLIDSDDAASYSIAADTSALRLRPNRSEEALELNDRGILSDEATLRENGFDADDQMSADQVATWLTRKVAQGSTTPELVEAALRVMGAKLDVAAASPAAPGETQEARPTPSLQGHPTQEPPDPSETESKAVTASGYDESEAAVTAAASVMVYRALERAGNKVKSKLGGRLPGIAAADLYRHVALDFNQMPVDFLLEDAWTTVETFAPQLGVGAMPLTHALDSYTRDLIQHRKPLDFQTLRSHLTGLSRG